MKTQKKSKLTIKEQIQHLEDAGVKFNLVSKEEAEEYLYANTYFFKLKAYDKNYSKNAFGKYVNLDFGYLKELAIIDMHFRKLVLSICLQVEHFLKVDINKHFSLNETEDGYNIVKEFTESSFYQSSGGFDRKLKSHYNEDLIAKYNGEYALWNVMEIISFGELIELYKFYFDKYEPKKAKMHNLLYSAKHLRNACAHNNCIINNINKQIEMNKFLVNLLNKKTNLSSEVIHKKCSKVIVNDFVSLLYCYSQVVTSLGVKERIKIELDEFIERTKRNITYFKTNSEILSLFNFFETIIEIFA